MNLRLDVSFGGGVLGIQRVEILVQSLFVAFAAVDCAADLLFVVVHLEPPLLAVGCKPKKRRPPQCLPVIDRAIAEASILLALEHESIVLHDHFVMLAVPVS